LYAECYWTPPKAERRLLRPQGISRPLRGRRPHATKLQRGLPHLVSETDDPELTAAIRTLADDPVPSVRYLLAVYLWATCDPAPGLFWKVAQKYLQAESTPAILDAVARSLSALGR
jgi:hypothetical protein